MMERFVHTSLFHLLILFVFSVTANAKTTEFITLKPGLEYAKLTPWTTQPKGSIHAFKINPALYQLDLAFTKDYPNQLATVTTLAKATDALITINGGFFEPDRKPLGLRIQDSHEINPIRPISWWGIFYIDRNQPYIRPLNRFTPSKTISLALQSGPRLVIRGTIPNLKDGRDNRSAICITREKEIILIATEYLPLTTTELAEIIRAPEQKNGLGCYYALNLDGGSSTSLYAHIEDFKLHIPSLVAISDAIVVKAQH